MRRARWALWLVMLAGRAVPAQDGAAALRLLEQIRAQEASFWPDQAVAPNKTVLFRGPLQPSRTALEQLAALGEAGIPALAQLLQHPRVHARANAAWALSQIGGPNTLPPLLGASTDAWPAIRYQVALALGFTGSAQALTVLNTLAGDRDAAVRNAAIQTGSVLRDILAAEQEPTPAARFTELVKLAAQDAARQRLVRYGAEAVPALVAALDGDDRARAFGAAAALAQIGDPRGLEELWKRLAASVEKKAPEHKFAVALAEYRSPQAWEYLGRMLQTEAFDSAPLVQYYALRRLFTFEHADRLKLIHGFLERQLTKGVHKLAIRGPETDLSPVATVCELLAAVGNQSSVALLDRIIGEAPPPEQSIVKTLAEKAKAECAKRGT